jgi:prevent-host-death family protein
MASKESARVVSATTGRRRLGQILDRAHRQRERFVLTYRNKPVAVLLDVDEYARLMKHASSTRRRRS